MVQKKAAWEEIKAMIGKNTVEKLEIDKSIVRNYCQCIGDPNPKWQDTAPPGLLTTVLLTGGGVALGIPQPFAKGVAAGADWEFYKPIKVGDVITTEHEFADLQDKSSEKGRRAIIVFKSKHTNQRGEVVAVSTNNLMSFE